MVSGTQNCALGGRTGRRRPIGRQPGEQRGSEECTGDAAMAMGSTQNKDDATTLVARGSRRKASAEVPAAPAGHSIHFGGVTEDRAGT